MKIRVSFSCYKSFKKRMMECIQKSDLKVGAFLEASIGKLHLRGTGEDIRLRMGKLQKRRTLTLGRRLVVVSNEISAEKSRLLGEWCRAMDIRKNKALHFAVEQLLEEIAPASTAIWPDEALNPAFQVENPQVELARYVTQCARLRAQSMALHDVPVTMPVFLDYSVLLLAMVAHRPGSNVPFDSLSYGLVRDCLTGRRVGYTSAAQLERLGQRLLETWKKSSGEQSRHREDVVRRVRHLLEGRLRLIRLESDDLKEGLSWMARTGIDLQVASDLKGMERVSGSKFAVATAREGYEGEVIELAVARPA